MRRNLGSCGVPGGGMVPVLAATAQTPVRVASTRNVLPSRSVMFREMDSPVAAPAPEETP